MASAKPKKEGLTYRGHPLRRSGNLIYYGSMADRYIIIMQILESKDFQDISLATKVSVQLQLTDQTVRSKDRVIRKSDKDGFYTALDVGCVWLERALAGK